MTSDDPTAFEPSEFQLLSGENKWGQPLMTAVCKGYHPNLSPCLFPSTVKPIVATVCWDEAPATLADLIDACREHWEGSHADG